MKTSTLVTCLALTLGTAFTSAASAVGCGSSTSATTSSGTKSTSAASSSAATGSSSSGIGGGTSSTSTSGSTSSGGHFPAPPTLGKQIDRLGRPAANTALNNTFNPDAGAAGAEKDVYNADSNEAGWTAAYAPVFTPNLGIIDALDGVCGNQFGYTSTTGYAFLAGTLADDRLYLNTAGTTLNQYLAVEANAVGTANTDQGGRALTYNVMDTSYTLLAEGAMPSNPVTITNGITVNNVSFLKTFPYEAAPN